MQNIKYNSVVDGVRRHSKINSSNEPHFILFPVYFTRFQLYVITNCVFCFNY